MYLNDLHAFRLFFPVARLSCAKIKKVGRSSRRDLVVGSWKVQILVESSGDVHVHWK